MMKLLAVALVLSLASVALAGNTCDGTPYSPCVVFYQNTCADESCTPFASHQAMITAVVNGVFTTAIETTTNTSKVGYYLRRYFDGTFGGNTVDFTVSGNNQNRLAGHLVNFFGVTLGCTAESTNCGTVWNNTGYPSAPLADAHATLEIKKNDFNRFNQLVVDVIASVKHPKAGDDFDTTLTAVRGVLDGTVDAIVFPATLSICDRYTGDLSNFQLMDLIVNKTVTSVVSDAALLRYFDGSISGIAAFTKNAALLRHLETNLVTFFGQEGVLDCTDRDFPAYEGADLVTAHNKLNISTPDFGNFNTRLIAVLQELGVSQADRTAVRSVLDGTAGSIVCNGKPCASAKAPSSASGIVASVAVALGAAAAALF